MGTYDRRQVEKLCSCRGLSEGFAAAPEWVLLAVLPGRAKGGTVILFLTRLKRSIVFGGPVVCYL